MAVTVLLLVRPDLRGTALRGAERILGTVAGAVLATLLTHALPRSSSLWLLAGLTAGFALLALALQQNNRIAGHAITYTGSYAVFAACLTAYVVLLLEYGGLNERRVAVVRVLLTLLGGVLALTVHLHLNGKGAVARR